MSDTYNGTVEVRIIPPRLSRGDVQRVSFQIDETIWEEAFAKLPRDREIYPPAHARAEQMKRQRAVILLSIANSFAAKLAEHLLKLVAATDPIHGYSPEEWAEITRLSK